MARAKTPTKPKAAKPELTWFLDLVIEGDVQLLYEFPARTQVGAMRKARKVIEGLKVPDDGLSKRFAVTNMPSTKRYEGSINGELMVGMFGDVADPVPVMRVNRLYWWDKIKFELLDKL